MIEVRVSSDAKQPSGEYGAKDIQVLEGLEPVRKRPGMYIGSTGLDRPAPPRLGGRRQLRRRGHGRLLHRIDVTLLADGGCRVVDDGRGIPVDACTPAVQGMTGVEIALTEAARRRQVRRRAATRSPAACTASASRSSTRCRERLERRGRPRRQAPPHGVRQRRQAADQARGRRPTPPRGRTGTTGHVLARPHDLRASTEFRARTMLERFQMMAFLNKGLEIRFKDERPGHEHEPIDLQVRRRHHRLRQARQRARRRPLFTKVGYFEAATRTGQRSRSRSSGTPATTEGIHSFANGIATIEGGTHEEGFRTALTTVVNKYARAKNLLKEKDENLARRGHPRGPHRHHLGAPARAAVRGPDQGQARQRRRCARWSQKATNEKLADWLEENPTEANKIVKKADRRGAGPRRRPQGPRRHPPQVARSTAPACPTS